MIGHVLDGRRIGELRRARCLTQAELGVKLGVGQTAISKIESGRIGRPEYLAELAAFFGVRVWDLLVPPGPAEVPVPRRAGAQPVHDPPFWTVPEAAAVLGASRKVVYRLVKARELEAQRAGRSWRIPPASVRGYLARPAQPAVNPVPVCQQRPSLLRIDKGRLRALRQAQGWTQIELAGQAGLSLSSVSALETGHYTRTSAVPALAQALGVPPDELTARAPVPGA